jgi:hypothetical protein
MDVPSLESFAASSAEVLPCPAVTQQNVAGSRDNSSSPNGSSNHGSGSSSSSCKDTPVDYVQQQQHEQPPAQPPAHTPVVSSQQPPVQQLQAKGPPSPQRQQQQQQRLPCVVAAGPGCQPDAQLSDFMAVHAAVSSDAAAAPVHRSVSQLRSEQQQQQQQKRLPAQPQQHRRLSECVADSSLPASSASSSPMSGGSSSSSKGERGWLQQQWAKLSSGMHKKGGRRELGPGSGRSSGVGVPQSSGDYIAVEAWKRPSTAPGHLPGCSGANGGREPEQGVQASEGVSIVPAEAVAAACAAVVGAGMTPREAVGTASSAAAAHHQQQQGAGAARGARALRHELASLDALKLSSGDETAAAAAAGAGSAVHGGMNSTPQEAAEASLGTAASPNRETGDACVLLHEPQQQQQQEREPGSALRNTAQWDAEHQQQQQQQRQATSAFTSASVLSELWDPLEQPHASCIAAAAAARTIGGRWVGVMLLCWVSGVLAGCAVCRTVAPTLCHSLCIAHTGREEK